MKIHYYLTLYPMEAMIASQLEPEAFGAYMAIGTRRGSSERLIFAEVRQEALGDAFDLDYARSRCTAHDDGTPKNSVYLSVYRALEAAPLNGLGLLHLVTKDGRSLAIEPAEYTDPEPWKGSALYQELCPARPLVVSSLKPRDFTRYIAEDSSMVTMPAVFFADLRMPEFTEDTYTGNVGGYFDGKLKHLEACLGELESVEGKMSKVVDRSASALFNYQVIGAGLYAGSGSAVPVFYPMPSRELLKEKHYDWGKSALIF